MENILSAKELTEENKSTRAEYMTSRDTEDNVRVDQIHDNDEYKVYMSRWMMLFVVSFLNFSNAIMWLTFAPVADTFIAFYGISSLQLNILSMTFLFASIPLGFVATWVLDTIGLRASLLISAWLNAVGGVIRGVSALDIVPRNQAYTVLLIGQILTASAQPFVMFAPTKLAAVWFPSHRRATANMLGSMMKPFGNMAASIFIPLMVEDTTDIPFVLWLTAGLSIFITSVTTFGVQRARPPTPPSPSADKTLMPFFAGLKKVIANKNYLVLNLTFGGGQALYTALTAFMIQMLCPRGYSDEFSGLCTSLMLGVGLIMAIVVSVYVDKTKQFDEVFKVMYGMACLCGIAFTLVSRLRDQQVWVALITALVGAFGVSLYPIGFELAAEVTYPVQAATGSGLCLIGGQIQGVVYMFVMQYLTRPLPSEEIHLETGCYIPETINPEKQVFKPKDWTYANLFIFNVLSTAAFVLTVSLFKPKYKRLEAEKKVVRDKQKTVQVQAIYSTRL